GGHQFGGKALPPRYPSAIELATSDSSSGGAGLEEHDAATESLHATGPIEFGQIVFVTNLSCLYPTYIRAESYLAAGKANGAAAEFQKILDHSGIVWNCWTGALAHLGLARANALESRTSLGVDADAARV